MLPGREFEAPFDTTLRRHTNPPGEMQAWPSPPHPYGGQTTAQSSNTYPDTSSSTPPDHHDPSSSTYLDYGDPAPSSSAYLDYRDPAPPSSTYLDYGDPASSTQLPTHPQVHNETQSRSFMYGVTRLVAEMVEARTRDGTSAPPRAPIPPPPALPPPGGSWRTRERARKRAAARRRRRLGV